MRLPHWYLSNKFGRKHWCLEGVLHDPQDELSEYLRRQCRFDSRDYVSRGRQLIEDRLWFKDWIILDLLAGSCHLKETLGLYCVHLGKPSYVIILQQVRLMGSRFDMCLSDLVCRVMRAYERQKILMVLACSGQSLF